MEYYDLIIVGAGPAGMCLARELTGSRLRILILDKKKNAEDVAYNTSGSFINPKNWNLPDYIFHPINRLYFSSKNKLIIKEENSFVIDRKKLLSFMEAAARENENLVIDYGIIINDIAGGAEGINYIVYTKNGKENRVSAKLFADCSGISAVLGKKLGISSSEIQAMGIEYLVPLKKEPHAVDLFVGGSLEGGYGWIFPVDDSSAIIGFGTLFKNHFPHIEESLKNMWQIKRVSERCDFDPKERNIAIFKTGSPLKKFTAKNILIIGDSALQANPLIGEGIRFGMESARIAAKWVKRAFKEDNLKLIEGYGREWKKNYYLKHKIAFWIQKMIKKNTHNDELMDSGVCKLGKLSAKDFRKLLSGDLSFGFLAKLFLLTLIK